ncbi:MAG: glycosyltransferase family 4 protein [Nostoc sp.]|uniref:glycosyltransferase family 4 protein n=1 Tax=Nostoc sp. TaxID=1180 RepID=UPI002FF5DA6B
MKVLLAGSLLGYGGIQSHLRWLIKALGEEGYEILAVSVGIQTPSDADLRYLQKFQSGKVEFLCFPAFQKQKFDFHLSKLQRLAEITTIIKKFSPDVYLAVGTGWNLFLPPLLSRTKTRLIFHEVMSGFAGNWHDSRWAARWCFDDVVGQSPTVAKTFAESFGWKKPVCVLPAIPEPLEVTAFLPKVTSKKVEVGKAKAALFSRLVPHKQAFWLVQQWNSLKDVLHELHIHGGGPEEALIKEYISFHSLGDRVKCFGRYPEGQAYVDLLSSYDLTLLPTVGAEGAPLVLLESMACGIPFVAYGVGGIRDYGVDNTNVIIVPPEPWVTNQAKEFTTTGKPSQTKAFIDAVGEMSHKLAEGKINQMELQQFYLERYSYQVLKNAWLSYLCK